MSQPVQRFDFIDAFRGYAILGVMLVHAAAAVPVENPTLRLLLEQGARGVQLFYVASAFTLMLSWDERLDGILPFLIRRAFRIVPMFWAALGLYWFVDLALGSQRSPVDVAATAFFVPTVYPMLNANVVPSGWTVTCEVAFYALFPIFVWLLRRWWLAVLAAAVATYLAMKAFHIWDALLRPIATGGDEGSFGVFLYFWFPNQAPIFIMGIAAYLGWRSNGRLPKWSLRCGFLIGLAAMLVIPFKVQQSHLLYYYGMAFSVILFCVASGAATWIATRPMRLLGRISYSAYLLHFLVITGLGRAVDAGFDPLAIGQPGKGDWRWAALLVIILALTIPAAFLTYDYVERPFIRLGHRVAERLTRSRAGRMSTHGARSRTS